MRNHTLCVALFLLRHSCVRTQTISISLIRIHVTHFNDSVSVSLIREISETADRRCHPSGLALGESRDADPERPERDGRR